MIEPRCTECGAPLLDGLCGACSPTGEPQDKLTRRERAAIVEREKELWDQRVLRRKIHDRPEGPGHA